MSEPFAPVRYDPLVEQLEPRDEREAINQLEDTFRSIFDTTSKDYGHAVRACTPRDMVS
jgi:hypothetical protein